MLASDSKSPVAVECPFCQKKLSYVLQNDRSQKGLSRSQLFTSYRQLLETLFQALAFPLVRVTENKMVVYRLHSVNCNPWLCAHDTRRSYTAWRGSSGARNYTQMQQFHRLTKEMQLLSLSDGKLSAVSVAAGSFSKASGPLLQSPGHFALKRTVSIGPPLHQRLTYIHICMNERMYVRMYVCMHACMHVCMYLYRVLPIHRSNCHLPALPLPR